MEGQPPLDLSISTSNTVPDTWQALNKHTFIKIHSMNEWSMYIMLYALFYVLFPNYPI